jgi:hypothetical protein
MTAREVLATARALAAGDKGLYLCAAENGTCSFSGPQSVAFGGNGIFTYQTLTGGTGWATRRLPSKDLKDAAGDSLLTRRG